MDKEYWNTRYIEDDAPWDIGQASPTLINYVAQLNDKSISVLIPGAGNAYEAIALNEMGFTDITVLDISDFLINKLSQEVRFRNIKLVNEDFFDHVGRYDLILEQTFFCALPPERRSDYVNKMYDLLIPGGKLVGVLFGVIFEKKGPPWGGTFIEYQSLFVDRFDIHKMETSMHSITPREGNEYFIKFVKKK